MSGILEATAKRWENQWPSRWKPILKTRTEISEFDYNKGMLMHILQAEIVLNGKRYAAAARVSDQELTSSAIYGLERKYKALVKAHAKGIEDLIRGESK